MPPVAIETPAELELAAQAEVIRHNAGAMLESASPRTAG